MRFIDTTTLKFAEIPDSELGDEFPEHKYANLSHRWGVAAEEVSYVDVNESRDYHGKQGFAKFKGFCDLAASLGYKYGWDDTCCINKGDLNELNEAINSMYRWYQMSAMCIVYLEDVGPGRKSMMDSEWFTRGWTLQELIGPQNAAFYDCNWRFLGHKSDLLEELSTKTGIPVDVLSHAASPSSCSVAQRMSWAAHRTTTRIEDRAYSLLGIFGVHMPQIYGEREKAFRRLQQAIVQQGKDESIFAWSMSSGQTTSGLYAPSLECFSECSEIISMRGSTGFSENNGEISISLKTNPHSMETYYAFLNCTYESKPNARIAIIIARISAEADDYVRVPGMYPGGIHAVAFSNPDRFKTRSVQVPTDPTGQPLDYAYGFWLRAIEPPGYEDAEVQILSKARNDSDSSRVYIDVKDWGSAGMIYINPKVVEERSPFENEKGWSKIRWIKLGFDDDFNPVLLLANGRSRRMFRSTEYRRDADVFERACQEDYGSQLHQTIFDNGWINSPANVPTKSFGWHEGVTVLKVDKRKGMSGVLDALNIGIEVELVANLSPYGGPLGKTGEHQSQIWAVSITERSGSDPEKTLRERESQESWESCIACCCTNDYGRGHAEEESRKQGKAREKRIMTQADLTRLRI